MTDRPERRRALVLGVGAWGARVALGQCVREWQLNPAAQRGLGREYALFLPLKDHGPLLIWLTPGRSTFPQVPDEDWEALGLSSERSKLKGHVLVAPGGKVLSGAARTERADAIARSFEDEPLVADVYLALSELVRRAREFAVNPAESSSDAIIYCVASLADPEATAMLWPTLFAAGKISSADAFTGLSLIASTALDDVLSDDTSREPPVDLSEIAVGDLNAANGLAQLDALISSAAAGDLPEPLSSRSEAAAAQLRVSSVIPLVLEQCYVLDRLNAGSATLTRADLTDLATALLDAMLLKEVEQAISAPAVVDTLPPTQSPSSNGGSAPIASRRALVSSAGARSWDVPVGEIMARVRDRACAELETVMFQDELTRPQRATAAREGADLAERFAPEKLMAGLLQDTGIAARRAAFNDVRLHLPASLSRIEYRGRSGWRLGPFSLVESSPPEEWLRTITEFRDAATRRLGELPTRIRANAHRLYDRETRVIRGLVAARVTAANRGLAIAAAMLQEVARLTESHAALSPRQAGLAEEMDSAGRRYQARYEGLRRMVDRRPLRWALVTRYGLAALLALNAILAIGRESAGSPTERAYLGVLLIAVSLLVAAGHAAAAQVFLIFQRMRAERELVAVFKAQIELEVIRARRALLLGESGGTGGSLLRSLVDLSDRLEATRNELLVDAQKRTAHYRSQIARSSGTRVVLADKKLVDQIYDEHVTGASVIEALLASERILESSADSRSKVDQLLSGEKDPWPTEGPLVWDRLKDYLADMVVRAVDERVRTLPPSSLLPDLLWPDGDTALRTLETGWASAKVAYLYDRERALRQGVRGADHRPVEIGIVVADSRGTSDELRQSARDQELKLVRSDDAYRLTVLRVVHHLDLISLMSVDVYKAGGEMVPAGTGGA